MTEQLQKANAGSLAIQSGGDTIIGGLSAADMRHILESLAAQLPTYTAIAREIVDARLTDFEKRILEKFTDTNKTSAQAFKDPDFQYMLTRSQHAYARSGDETIRDILIDLIAERSKQSNRTRLTMTLNDAVEKAAALTNNEFAALSLCFYLKYTLHRGIRNVHLFSARLFRHVTPLLPDITAQEASFQYIEGVGCGIRDLGTIDLRRILIEKYGGIFSHGFTMQQLHDRLPVGKKHMLDADPILIQCINNPLNKPFDATTKETFLQKTAHLELNKDEMENIWNLFVSTFWSEEDFRTKIPPIIPLFDVWNGTDLKRLRLTSVGMAIGHANLRRLTEFNADLRVWIG